MRGAFIIADYRNRVLQQSSWHTGRPYARSTINDRVRTICRFYEWVHQQGLVQARPFHFVDVRVWGRPRESMLMHTQARPTVTEKYQAH
ncbi:MAG: putative phage integrase [Nevskia sp.]|nr:putative phage integrase [Nevskia sp.]